MANIYRRRKNFFRGLGVNANLIIVNVILFLVFGIFIAFNPSYIDFIAIKPANILQGKYLWTFLTSMFMHAGFFHLFANMFSMFFVGNLAERIIGMKRYFLFYMASGIFAALVFILSALVFPSDLNTFAVGASGALFGVIGLLMLLTPNLPVYVMFIPIPIKMKYAAPGILAVLWLISVAGNLPIGNSAHIGGLIAGLVYGFYLKTKFPHKTEKISGYFR